MNFKFIALLFGIIVSSSLFANLRVHNKTPYPIKFAAKWDLDTSKNSGKFFRIEPGASKGIGGDLWNKKSWYIAEAYIDNEWQKIFYDRVSKFGNREITIFYDHNADKFTWKDAIY